MGLTEHLKRSVNFEGRVCYKEYSIPQKNFGGNVNDI
ncbi:hypothetical protein SAMN05878482_105247 [Peribacillus simplex]|uniref:Uncharacterized protein n=1 Tax=Peribacillus simplex TaxID=1478 RepID=A0A9X8WLP0_9BACI|nr:hypothetical protein SAMN05878482_105247 [Peribacillus simplex]